MEKNIMYFARKAEEYCLKMAGEGASHFEKYVLVDPVDESYLIVPGYTHMKPTDLLFKVKMEDGQCVSEFLKNGVPLDETIGLFDQPVHKVEGVKIEIPAEPRGFYLYYELPAEIKEKSPRYIFKLNSFDELTDQITWGWGDDNLKNHFEIIKECIDIVEKEAEDGRFYFSFDIECDREFDTPFLDFYFTHFEVADNPMSNFVYVCYDIGELMEDDD